MELTGKVIWKTKYLCKRMKQEIDVLVQLTGVESGQERKMGK